MNGEVPYGCKNRCAPKARRASPFGLRGGLFFAGRHRGIWVFGRFDRGLIAEFLVSREHVCAFGDEFELVAGEIRLVRSMLGRVFAVVMAVVMVVPRNRV